MEIGETVPDLLNPMGQNGGSHGTSVPRRGSKNWVGKLLATISFPRTRSQDTATHGLLPLWNSTQSARPLAPQPSNAVAWICPMGSALISTMHTQSHSPSILVLERW